MPGVEIFSYLNWWRVWQIELSIRLLTYPRILKRKSVSVLPTPKTSYNRYLLPLIIGMLAI